MNAEEQRLPRVGVVGVGHLGKHHARLLKGLDCDLVAVADPNEAARTMAVQTHGVAAFADHRELLADSRVDVVSITTPSFRPSKPRDGTDTSGLDSFTTTVPCGNSVAPASGRRLT